VVVVVVVVIATLVVVVVVKGHEINSMLAQASLKQRIDKAMCMKIIGV